MFHIDITCEDIRFLADTKNYGNLWEVTITDTLTGSNKKIALTGSEVSATIALMVHPEGSCVDSVEAYKMLEPIYKDWPRELRPIP